MGLLPLVYSVQQQGEGRQDRAHRYNNAQWQKNRRKQISRKRVVTVNNRMGELPYRLFSIYTSSRIVRVAAASGLAQEFRMVLLLKVKIKNSPSSVYWVFL